MKTIKHVWTVLCRKSVTDKETNNINLMEVLEKLDVVIETKESDQPKATGKVVVPFNFEIVTMWARSDFNDKQEKKVEAKVEIVDPNGAMIGSMASDFILSPEFRRMRSVGRLPNIGLTVSGKYLFKISGKEVGDKSFTEVAEVPLEVVIIKKPTRGTNELN